MSKRKAAYKDKSWIAGTIVRGVESKAMAEGDYERHTGIGGFLCQSGNHKYP